MRPDMAQQYQAQMLRNMNGMNMKQGNLVARAAMANSQNKYVLRTPYV